MKFANEDNFDDVLRNLTIKSHEEDNKEQHEQQKNEKSVEFFSDYFLACKNSHAVVIMTEWDEFVFFDWKKIYSSLVKPANIFDGRNILDKKQMETIGFKFFGIGK